MKRRVRKIVNFFAFNLLFFALYLNFIHKDKSGMPDVAIQKTAAFSGTAVANNKTTESINSNVIIPVANKDDENELAALKLSIN